MYWEINN